VLVRAHATCTGRTRSVRGTIVDARHLHPVDSLFENPSARQFRMGFANGHLGMQPQRVLMGPSFRLQVVEAGYPAQLTP
jgi:hypothetical protein